MRRVVEVEVGGVVHAIRMVGVVRENGAPGLVVSFWGRDAWLPAGSVTGQSDDSQDVAVQVGLRESEDYQAAVAS